jgi:riboflavin biosynthesis pyrimidine reductase
MSVIAYLVIGRDGSSTLNGSSAGITSVLDRMSFLDARREFDCIVIGGQSARSEPYSKTPVPLVIVSRSRPQTLDVNPKAYWWNCTPAEAVQRASESFGSNICVEGGINFLNELMTANLIDELHLSITPTTGGENKVDQEQLLAKYSAVTRELKDETIFIVAKSPIAMKQK